MVRDAMLRIKKYEQKLDPTVIQTRFTALKEMMVDQVNVRFADLVTFENQVKLTILEAAGIPTINIPFYLNYAREVYTKGQRFSGTTLCNECSLILDKWVARGLDRDVLTDIAEAFGVTIPCY